MSQAGSAVAFEPGALTCDVCHDPGACCRDFPLNIRTDRAGRTVLEAMVWAAGWSYSSPDRMRSFIGFPFLPNRIDAQGYWRWRCVDLLEDGRCGNYENRPYGPCVLYKPQHDEMCAMHPGADVSRQDTGFLKDRFA